MSTATEREPAWLTRDQVAEMLDVPPGAVNKLANRGQIRTRQLPAVAVRARYSAEDVRRLANGDPRR